MNNESERKHVIVVGGGFAGIGCVRKLAPSPEVHITLIDRNNYHQFQPLLYQVATSQLVPADVAFSLRRLFHKHPNVDVKLAEVTSVDPKAKTVTTRSGEVYRGDYLVLAAGSQANFFKTPGADQHTFPLYSLDNAELLRSRILQVFEDADRDPKLIDEGALNFVIVGGGPTGTEMAGALAEMINSTMTVEYRDLAVSAARIYLVDHGHSLLKPFSEKAHEYAARVLQRDGVQLRLGASVQEVGPGHVRLSDGTTIKARCVIWGGGLMAAPLAGNTGLPQGRGGRIDVLPDLTVEGFPGVYVLGDFANVPSPDGKSFPQLGSVALQAGQWAAKNILAEIAGKPRMPFYYHDKGIMAMIGRNAAIAEIGEHRHELHGPVGFAAWLGVHIYLMTGVRTRVEALVNWGWDYFSRTRGPQVLDRSDAARIDWGDDPEAAAPIEAPGAEARDVTPAPEPLEARLSAADDRIRLSRWTPPQTGVAPRVRLGKRWVNVLWAIPLAIILIVIGVAVAKELRQFPAVQDFIARYPGAPASPPLYSGFPGWLRYQHFLNLFFMMFIIRAGIQILADHPRLYWNRDSTPGTEWFRFQHEVPTDRVWTAKDDSLTIPQWLGLPGIRHSIGLARWWHFSFDLFWLLNGVIFYVLLFTTYQWQRLVPTSWDVFLNALSTQLQYLSLDFPVDNGWVRYNSLQQLAYFTTVFIAAPVAVLTGLMQGPAFANKLGWFAKVLNRQAARSIHFLVLLWMLFFILVHVTMVFVTGALRNLNHITVGTDNTSREGLAVFGVGIAVVIVAWALASPFTIRYARFVQRAGERIIGPLKGLFEMWDTQTQYTEQDISPYLWPNGRLPDSAEFNALVTGGFADYKLRIDGLVENPCEFTYAELKAMPKQEQTTMHFCIQGWSGVAKWGGVPMRRILELARPTPEARYAVFYSFAEGGEGGRYYDVHKIHNMEHELTILAYEMNGSPLTILHGAPLRLRCENELGFKQVKWIEAIEFVRDFAHLGAGQGGYNEDHEFYGYRMPI